MSKNKLIFGGLVVLAAIVVINMGKKDPTSIFGKVANLGA